MDGEAALHHARISRKLKKNADTAQLAFLSCLLLKRFGEGKKWYIRVIQF
jgi:hypothetical protein